MTAPLYVRNGPAQFGQVLRRHAVQALLKAVVTDHRLEAWAGDSPPPPIQISSIQKTVVRSFDVVSQKIRHSIRYAAAPLQAVSYI